MPGLRGEPRAAIPLSEEAELTDRDGTHELVLKAQAGDAEAYDRLFDRVADRLLVYIRVRMGHALRARMDPMDVLQETYLEAHRSFERFQPRSEQAFVRWIHRIADNRILDLASHGKAQKRAPPSPLVQGSTALGRIRADYTGPSTSCARREQHEQLVEAIEGLEDRERQAVLLRYFSGQTLDAIAQELGCSDATVRRDLGNGLVKLGATLQRLLEG